MAWIKVKSSINNNIILMTESAYNNFYKHTKIFSIIEEQPKKTESKTSEIKENIENDKDLQFPIKDEVNTTGKNKKKTRV